MNLLSGVFTIPFVRKYVTNYDEELRDSTTIISGAAVTPPLLLRYLTSFSFFFRCSLCARATSFLVAFVSVERIPEGAHTNGQILVPIKARGGAAHGKGKKRKKEKSRTRNARAKTQTKSK